MVRQSGPSRGDRLESALLRSADRAAKLVTAVVGEVVVG